MEALKTLAGDRGSHGYSARRHERRSPRNIGRQRVRTELTTMSKHYVLGLMAANRTGILAAVSTALAELAGNIRDIRLTVVEGYFTILLSAEFPDHRDPEVIVGHLEGVGRPFGLSVILREAEPAVQAPQHAEACDVYQLTLTGRDSPGVLAKFSARLAREQIDITDLYGWRNQGENPQILLELAVPRHVDLPELRRELKDIGDSFGLEVDLGRIGQGGTRDPRPAGSRLPVGRG